MMVMNIQPCTIEGRVVEGKHIGHTIGFPTANIKPLPGQHVPENGVYAGEIVIEGADEPRLCLINHGLQPTIPSGKTTIEVYILDFHENIYGKKVRLSFLHFIRKEKKFESVELLKAQLTRDVATARQLTPPPRII